MKTAKVRQLSTWVLNRWKMVRHLKSRHFDIRDYSTVHVGDGCVTFELWNLSGQLVGYQVYDPSKPKIRMNLPRMQKYYTYITKNKSNEVCAIGVWGLETYDWRKPLFVLEGVFNASRLHNYGIPAIAVLGNDQKKLRPWLDSLPNPKYSICDGDEAGKKVANIVDFAVFLTDGLDVGDLEEHELIRILGELGFEIGPDLKWVGGLDVENKR